MRTRKPIFHGWYIVVAGLFCYGLGISPAYYSWGFFAPEVMEELDLSRAQVGDVFGIFHLMFSIVAPIVGIALDRFGIRATVTVGALCSALGFWMTSRADTLMELYLSYGLIGGIGIGFSTILPAQTLAVNWFVRSRARATAIIMVGGSTVGMLVTPFDELVIRHWSWREGWMAIAAASLVCAVVAALFLRNKPEDVGLVPDGDAGADKAPTAGAKAPAEEPNFTAGQAIRTPLFFFATFAALANQLPWAIVTAHGRIHLEDIGLTSAAAAAILGVRVGVSTAGRLSAALGDFFSPARVLGAALVIVGLGCGGMVLARSAPLAVASIVLLGLGYGAAYISIPVVFGYFFGRKAFAGTSGVRIAILAVSGWLGPRWAGAAADASGSYLSTFVVLALVCVAGAAAILFCPRPGATLVIPATAAPGSGAPTR